MPWLVQEEESTENVHVIASVVHSRLHAKEKDVIVRAPKGSDVFVLPRGHRSL